MNGKCPFCGAKVTLPKSIKTGDLIYCSECDAELEVISLSPVELDWPLEAYEEDYEYEDEYEDDYEDNY